MMVQLPPVGIAVVNKGAGVEDATVVVIGEPIVSIGVDVVIGASVMVGAAVVVVVITVVVVVVVVVVEAIT